MGTDKVKAWADGAKARSTAPEDALFAKFAAKP
jgi:hypothetical protein